MSRSPSPRVAVAPDAAFAYGATIMVRWLSVALALSLIGAPAAAQTSKKKPKTEAKPEAKVEKKKPKPRVEPEAEEEEEEEEPRPKRKRKRKAKVEDDPDEDTGEETRDAPKKKFVDEDESRERFLGKTRFGVGLLLGPALSTSNSEGKLTPLPFASLSFVINSKLSGPVYFRLEPSLGYLRRRSTVNVVRQVDASEFPDVKIRTEDIVNRVTALDFSIRNLLGYDYSPMLTGRVGFLLGLGTASTDAGACSGDNRSTGFLYGAHLTPLAVRIPAAGKFAEVGLAVEYRSQMIPRCDVPLKGNFEVDAGSIATFRPERVDTRFGSVAVALQGALLF